MVEVIWNLKINSQMSVVNLVATASARSKPRFCLVCSRFGCDLSIFFYHLCNVTVKVFKFKVDVFPPKNHATFNSPLVWCRMWISLVGSSKKQTGLVFKWCTVDRDRNWLPGCLASFGETNQLKTCECRFKRQKLASFDWVSFFCGLSSSWGESLYERFVPMVKLKTHMESPHET